MKLTYLIALITASGLASAVPVEKDNSGLDLDSILSDVTLSSGGGPTSTAAPKASASAGGSSQSSGVNGILNGLTSGASATAAPSAIASLSPSSSPSSLSSSSDDLDLGSILQDVLGSSGSDVESLVLNINFTDVFQKIQHSGLFSKAKNFVSNAIHENDGGQSSQ